ncbi:Trafficking protein particle complex subunit 4 [Oopsacas minuta]|uniref:Trafficking protein particle complex subunit n=1 Tax=Oopsacas minuta TaxID=111878 RepID=A0AAV7K5A5_9METZ|nr:Trafficking protein particle complex subunit 4 [Oopsacas minuta]
MTILALYVINRAGSLIFDHDFSPSNMGVEVTFTYPFEIILKEEPNGLVVSFGCRDGIKIGHVLVSINGVPVSGCHMSDGGDVREFLSRPENYPVSVRFSKLKPNVNERIMLSSMFNTIYHMASQLSPEKKSTGIQEMETSAFTLHCLQTLSGLKFIYLSEPKTQGVDVLLKKTYELYVDFALKNPFYNLEMPVRCELFDKNLMLLIEQSEKVISGNF